MQMCSTVMLIRNGEKKGCLTNEASQDRPGAVSSGTRKNKTSLLETLQPCKAFLSTEQLQSTQKGENLFSAATRLLYHCALEQRQTVYSFLSFLLKPSCTLYKTFAAIFKPFFFTVSEVFVY